MAINVEAILGVLGFIGKEIMTNKDAQKLLFGKYSDGKTRSLSDAINGEYKSPKMKNKENDFYEEWSKERKKKLKKKKKKHKNKKKHNKKYKYYKKQYKKNKKKNKKRTKSYYKL